MKPSPRPLKASEICLIVLALSGCSDPMTQGPDQCMRRELFAACMKALPAGPQSTKYNDWDDVVDSCGKQAYYLAMRRTDQIKDECRSQ